MALPSARPARARARSGRSLAVALCLATVLSACEGLSLPFQATPTPAPLRTAPPTPAPTPSPTPIPEIQVRRIDFAPNERGIPLSIVVAFGLRNPSAELWLYQGTAVGTFFTPDDRPLPQARPSITVDLAPGEEKLFAFPNVDTFGSIVGRGEVKVSGGQWLPAKSYPYPGSVPLKVSRVVETPTPRPPTPPPTPTPAPGATPRATPAPTPTLGPPPAAEFLVTNEGALGITGVVRGFAFSSGPTLIGLLECPGRLYAAKVTATVRCTATASAVLASPDLIFVAYPDLRPVLVIPTATPTPSPTPAPTPTPKPSPTP